MGAPGSALARAFAVARDPYAARGGTRCARVRGAVAPADRLERHAALGFTPERDATARRFATVGEAIFVVAALRVAGARRAGPLGRQAALIRVGGRVTEAGDRAAFLVVGAVRVHGAQRVFAHAGAAPAAAAHHRFPTTGAAHGHHVGAREAGGLYV